MNFGISLEPHLILSDSIVHLTSTVRCLEETMLWRGRMVTVRWPQCLLPRGSTSRWLQTTVSLDLDHYDQQAETRPVRYGSLGCLGSMMDNWRGDCSAGLKVIVHTEISVTCGCHFSKMKGLRSWPRVSRSQMELCTTSCWFMGSDYGHNKSQQYISFETFFI